MPDDKLSWFRNPCKKQKKLASVLIKKMIAPENTKSDVNKSWKPQGFPTPVCIFGERKNMDRRETYLHCCAYEVKKYPLLYMIHLSCLPRQMAESRKVCSCPRQRLGFHRHAQSTYHKKAVSIHLPYLAKGPNNAVI